MKRLTYLILGGVLATAFGVWAAEYEGGSGGGGGGGDTHPISDGTGIVKGSSDDTKIGRVEVDTNVPTGTTVVVTWPSSDLDLDTVAAFPTVDTTSLVEGSVDATKEMRIEVDGLTTGTVRVWTAPDQNLDLTPGTGDFSAALSGLTDNRLVRADGTTGLQDSGILVDDSDNLTNVGTINTFNLTPDSGSYEGAFSGLTDNRLIRADSTGDIQDSGIAIDDSDAMTGLASLSTTAFVLNSVTVTSTGTELNILDGVTSTTAELNILDGVTSTAAELNKLDANFGASPPATCTSGTVFIDTDETDDTVLATTADNSLGLCVATDTWVALENGGGGGSFDGDLAGNVLTDSTDDNVTIDPEDDGTGTITFRTRAGTLPNIIHSGSQLEIENSDDTFAYIIKKATHDFYLDGILGFTFDDSGNDLLLNCSVTGCLINLRSKAGQKLDLTTDGTADILFTERSTDGVTVDSPGEMFFSAASGVAFDVDGDDVEDGVTDSSSYWLCSANDCSTTCQVDISGGIIIGCT